MVLWFQKPIQKLLLISMALFVIFGAVNVKAEVTGPVVPTGKGEKCVEPTDVMRKNHMKFMLHQRDETMHNGIRTKQHSLKECISCHIQPDKNGQVARFGDDGHFCSSCHNYAGVNVDCFQCHADRPQELISLGHKIKPHHTAKLAQSTINEQMLKDFVKEVK